MIFLEITWVDSETSSGWEKAKDIDPPQSTVKSYGFLLKESEHFYTLVADIDESEEHYNRHMSIPKSSVKKKRKIKL